MQACALGLLFLMYMTSLLMAYTPVLVETGDVCVQPDAALIEAAQHYGEVCILRVCVCTVVVAQLVHEIFTLSSLPSPLSSPIGAVLTSVREDGAPLPTLPVFTRTTSRWGS